MSLKESAEEIFNIGLVGDWAFINFDCYIVIKLTDAEDGIAVLPIGRDAVHPHWVWDGNREAPTLTPSILHHSHPEWHGYLRAGKLVLA